MAYQYKFEIREVEPDERRFRMEWPDDGVMTESELRDVVAELLSVLEEKGRVRRSDEPGLAFHDPIGLGH